MARINPDKPKKEEKAKAKPSEPIPESKTSVGRPCLYSSDLADEICERLAGGESMRSISKDDRMPAMSTLFKWLREIEEFSQQYARAKEECADMYAEEIIEIADDGSNDWMEKQDKDGGVIGWQLNGEHVQRSRLRVDSRKWIASKLKPKKYGEKVTSEHTGPNGGPIETVERIIVRPETPSS